MAMLATAASWIEKRFGLAGTPFSPAWDSSWLAAAGKNPWALAAGPHPESLSAVHASVRLLTAGILGATPRVIKARADGGRDVVTTGNAAALLATMGHDLERTLYDWLLRGNGFAVLDRDSLVHVPYSRCKLVRKDGTREIWLEVTPQFSDVDQVKRYAEGQYLHLKMTPSHDELMGQSPLDRLAAGLGMAAQVVESASAVIRNATNPGAILTISGGLKQDTRERLRRDFAAEFTGKNAGRLAVLDFDNKIERIPTSEAMISDAFVQLARFGVAEVARCYGVPLSLLAEVGSVNRATADAEARAFAMFSVAPHARSVADAMSRLLLSREERIAGMSVEFDLKDMLIGQGVERADFAAKLVNSGIASINEIRDLVGLADVEGGDMIARPSNTLPQDKWLESGSVAPVAAPQPVKEIKTPSDAEKVEALLADNQRALQPKLRSSAKDRLRAMVNFYHKESDERAIRKVLQ